MYVWSFQCGQRFYMQWAGESGDVGLNVTLNPLGATSCSIRFISFLNLSYWEWNDYLNIKICKYLVSN